MDEVTLNKKEQIRLMVLNEVLAGRLTGPAAAELLGLSLRQTRRLLAVYRQAGAAGLAHGNRRRRERYPQAGMLLQVDGSKHDWLEGRGPWLTLHAAIDDATGEVVAAVFREEEDATGYGYLQDQRVKVQ